MVLVTTENIFYLLMLLVSLFDTCVYEIGQLLARCPQNACSDCILNFTFLLALGFRSTDNYDGNT